METAYLKGAKEAWMRKSTSLPLAEVEPGEPSVRANGESERLKILWIKMGGLYPVNTGGRLRSFHILTELSKKHDVTVLTTHVPGEDPDMHEKHLPGCKKVISIPFSAPRRDSGKFLIALVRSWFSVLPVDMYKFRLSRIRREVSDVLAKENFNLCIADFLYAVANVPDNIGVPLIYFSHNVEFMIWQRLCRNETNPVKKAILALEWRKMRHYESSVCKASDMTISVSEQDCELFNAQAPGSCVRDIPTGVDIDFFKSENLKENPLELVFSGSMDWHPNEDAILHFIDAILPLIRHRVPQVSLTVVGRNPSTKLVNAALEAGVEVTGTVDDIRPYVDQAAVYIVPLRVGGGTRLKIFEALSMGKAVVSTTVGAEGLPLEEGRHIVRADDAVSFADEVVNLLYDGDRRQRLGEAGRQLMEEKFSWARVGDAFESRCREVKAADGDTYRRREHAINSQGSKGGVNAE